jgi:hypothetical protein
MKACDGDGMVGVGPPAPSRQQHTPPGWANDHHLAHLATGGWRQAERRHQRQRSRAHQVTACLVTAKRRLVDERDSRTAAGEYQCGGAAGGPCPHHDGVDG